MIITPGITIRDRLRVLLPEDPESYYRTRELVPADMLGDIAKAKIVITNYHALQAPRDDGGLQGRPRPAARPRRGADDDRDRRPDAPARLRRAR